MTTAFTLESMPSLGELFRLFLSGKHLNRIAEPSLWAELEKQEEGYRSLFAALGYPVILGEMPGPHLYVYPRYTVVAEKLEALTSLGMLNSRMKDYFDLWILAKHSDFDGRILSRAVTATFERRRTTVPVGVPIGLSDEFINDAQKGKQWQGFLRKNALEPMSLATVVVDLRDFLIPVLAAIAAGSRHDYPWRAGAGWQRP